MINGFMLVWRLAKHMYILYYLSVIIHIVLEGCTMSSLVRVRSKSGRVYVYENTSYWDKISKKPKSVRKCLGHLDPETDEIVPNRIKHVTNHMPKQGRSQCSTYTYGVSALLDTISADIGIADTLQKVFPEDWSAILCCAYYLISEGNALSRVEQWSRQAITPYEKILADQRVSELLTRISTDKIREFFKLWFEQNKEDDDYYCMDVTSVSSYSEQNEFVRRGYNRDREKHLSQINLLMISGHTSHLPLAYQVLHGSVSDVTSMRGAVRQLDLIDAKRLHMVFDKGFYSENNINELYEKQYRFLMGVPFTTNIARDAVARHRDDDIQSYQHYISVLKDELYAVTEFVSWGSHRCWLHIYHDNVKAALHEREFAQRLRQEYEELVSEKLCPKHEADYKQFFLIKTTPVRGRKVEYNDEAIKQYRKNTVGWFVLMSNDIKDASTALWVYRMKDAVEKHFDDLKNDLDMKRLRIHSPETMTGRIFIQFVALIFVAKIKVVMQANDWLRNHNLQEVIDEMKSLHRVKLISKRSRDIITTLTAFQKEIVTLFQIRNLKTYV